MQKSSVEPEIFPTFQHKVERVPHFARVSEVRHIYVNKQWKTGSATSDEAIRGGLRLNSVQELGLYLV